MKICTKCKIEKELSEFGKNRKFKDGLKYNCKECCKEFFNKYYDKNKEKILNKARGNHNEYFKNRYKNKTVEEKSNFREYLREWSKKEENKIKRNKYKREIYNKVPKNIILSHLRKRIRDFVKNKIMNDSKYLELLGCSSEDYKQYLENQFTKEMNWDNYGSYWEIDHKKAISNFNILDYNEVRKAFHYTNTRPLTITENRRKSNK